MELPNYRLPSGKSVVMLMWDKAKDFLQRAFTVIFVATLIIWFLQSFDARLNPVTDSTDSLLATVGRFIAPLFPPMGFGDWQISTALITGFTAKEAVVSTLGILTGRGVDALSATLPALFTTTSAISFLTFTLLYTPCVAAISAIGRELGGRFRGALVSADAVPRCVGHRCGFVSVSAALCLRKRYGLVGHSSAAADRRMADLRARPQQEKTRRLLRLLRRLRRTLRQIQKVKIRACQKTGPYFLFQ